MKKLSLLILVVMGIALMQSCKNDDPSIIKVFVRSNSNELMEGVKVIIIGDVNSNPATLPYVDTVITNGSGFAEFNLADHYAAGDSDYEVAYFDIIAKTNTTPSIQTTGTVRSRVHTTAVETVYLP